MPHRQVILIVEDDDNDLLFVRRAFAEAGIVNPTKIVHDGAEAIAYLSGQDKFADRSEYPIPLFMLLDLRMPKINGFEVLKWLRQHPHLQNVRAIVLTGSAQQQDINLAYELGATSYLVKPSGFREFTRMLEALKVYWLLFNRPVKPELN